MLLIVHAFPDKPIFLMKPPIGKVKKKVFSSLDLQQQHQNLREFIPLVLEFSGCDSISAIYGKEEKHLLKIFKANASLLEYIRGFNSTDSTANEIEKAEECLFLFHRTTNYNISLDNL